MEELLDTIYFVVKQLSKERVLALAAKIKSSDPSKMSASLNEVVRTPSGAVLISKLINNWSAVGCSPEQLSGMLISAAHTINLARNEQKLDFVWTGPTTEEVSARRTEQALLEVIHSANRSLFMTSFVVYDVSTVMMALNHAIQRGVTVKVLIEATLDSVEQNGRVGISKMRSALPFAKIYYWSGKSDEFAGGRVHSKVAVSDERMVFITSANLTGHAMEKNMEAGILIEGGALPQQIERHFESLVNIGVVTAI